MNRTIRHSIAFILLVILSFGKAHSQDWMSSFEAAKRLAMVQDKMILMVWEGATLEPYPVIVEDESGKSALVEDLFDAPFLSRMIWKYFVPVSVGEDLYPEIYDSIKDRRDYMYMSKFNDGSLKVMDANGNILNVKPNYDEVQDITELIQIYYHNTQGLQPDLRHYGKMQNFTTAFRLGIKYIDMAIYSNDKARSEIIKLSEIYLKEAEQFLGTEDYENELALLQKLELIRLKQELVLDKPKRVLRRLNRLEPSEVHKSNEALVAFLYLTAYRVLKDENSARKWRPKLSLDRLEISQRIIDNNK